jgi:hypothetical protein
LGRQYESLTPRERKVMPPSRTRDPSQGLACYTLGIMADRVGLKNCGEKCGDTQAFDLKK